MKFKQSASMRFRSISAALRILVDQQKIDRAPAHETCIQWDLKIGLHKLNRPKESTSDWCWIVDHVVAEGSIKCLAVMGVRCGTLKQRNNWTLSLEDLEPFGLIPMVRSTGEEVKKALCSVSEKTGIKPRSLLSDRGSDLWLGIKEYQKEAGVDVITLYDVCHKVARELRKLFERDSEWAEFKEKANYTKKQLHCTSGAVFAPPAQRKKARYHNVDIIVDWAIKILKYEGQWDGRSYEKLKWVFDYQKKIEVWEQWVEIGRHTRDQVRESGFGVDTEELLIERLTPLPMAESSHQLACNLVDFVAQESSQMSGDERAPGTTEVIESLFGYYKHVKNGLWDGYGGMGRLILCMASRVGELTLELVREALENIKKSELSSWIAKCFHPQVTT
jgi:hypothetical protein